MSSILSLRVVLYSDESGLNSVAMVFVAFSCRSLSFVLWFIELRYGLSLFVAVIGLMSDEYMIMS